MREGLHHLVMRKEECNWSWRRLRKRATRTSAQSVWMLLLLSLRSRARIAMTWAHGIQRLRRHLTSR